MSHIRELNMSLPSHTNNRRKIPPGKMCADAKKWNCIIVLTDAQHKLPGVGYVNSANLLEKVW